MILEPLDPAAVPASEIPEALGRLEACRAVLLSRLMSPQPAPATPVSATLLTVAEAAKRLSIPRASMYEKVRRGEVQAVKLGRSIRFRLEDLEGYIDARSR